MREYFFDTWGLETQFKTMDEMIHAEGSFFFGLEEGEIIYVVG